MMKFLKVAGISVLALAVFIAVLIAWYWLDARASLQADIRACPSVTTEQATAAVLKNVLLNGERLFSKPHLTQKDVIIEERGVQVGQTGTLVPFRIDGVTDRRYFG
ncbi:phosphonate ABC transporter substrate-binding protein, partial [Klebsiella pneumoniae]